MLHLRRAALLALVGEASSAALAPEYAWALDRDDACILGGPSCSLVLSQLRASPRIGQSSSSERPVWPHTSETVGTDIGLLQSGVPAMSVAAQMMRESLKSANPAGEAVAPAVLHSELPWAAAAAREAEQKAAEVEVQPESQAATTDQAQPRPRLQTQPQLQPQAQAQRDAPGASAQPMQPQSPARTARVQPYVVPPETVLAAEEAPPSVQRYDVQQYESSAMPIATQDEIGEDDSDDAEWKEEKRLLDSETLDRTERAAMAAEHFRKVLWADDPNPEDAQPDTEASNKARVDGATASLANSHRRHTGHSKVRSHSKAPQSHGKAHKTPGGAKKHAHSQVPVKTAEHTSTEGSYTKTASGYKDVVLAGPAGSKHHAHTRAHFPDVS